MKKITVAIAAVIMGLIMASCGSKPSPTETVYNAMDAFYAQAEETLKTIDNADDFMEFFEGFEDQRTEAIENAFTPYLDEEGNLTKITEEEFGELQQKIQERATAYNRIEAVKAAEFLEPLIAQYENAVNALCEKAKEADPDTYAALVADFEKAESDLRTFGSYDNVLPELQERAQAAEAKLNELIGE